LNTSTGQLSGKPTTAGTYPPFLTGALAKSRLSWHN
jgi:hypothetical protein